MGYNEDDPGNQGHHYFGPGVPGPAWLVLHGVLPMSNQKTIFVILSATKNLSLKMGEILHSAALRSE
jgi:hypothetical protein